MRLLGAALLLCCATHVSAQDPTLDRVHNLAATGRFTEARNTLDQWDRQFADPRSSASMDDRARAGFLRATLSTDAKEAEEVYLSVILSYPSSAAAPQALLRLGQALVAQNDAARAVTYLERLRNDYPRSSARETGFLWLARAQIATGAARAACITTRDGIAATRNENLRLLLELERERACNQQPASPDSPARTPPATVASPPASSRPASSNARFAVQSGAFRERASAEATASQLRARGFDARVVITDGPLFRVRFGFFTSMEDANAAARRARDAGFNALIVNDVPAERKS